MRVWNCPVLPVMPCVMTLVCLSMRMDMVVIPAQAGIQWLSLGEQVGVEIAPVRIRCLDHGQLPVTLPLLDLLLARDGFLHIVVRLEPDQRLDAVLLRK